MGDDLNGSEFRSFVRLVKSVESLKDRRVLVMGLGLFGGGVGATRFLVGQGAHVTVTDLRSAEDLQASVQALDGLPVTYKLGGHDLGDFTDADLVVANPAVSRSSPFLMAAEEAGVSITTEISLFVSHCSAKIIGVTGSSGKTTTTTLIGEMLKRVDARTLVGGNMGRSLLDDLPHITPDLPVVLELSSFQLDRLGDLPWSPHIAVVTNFAPNHIDVHGSLEAYRLAKMNMVKFQSENDWTILNGGDTEVISWSGQGKRFLFDFGIQKGDQAFVREDKIWCVFDGEEREICNVSDLQLPGQHNLANALAAVSAAVVWGVPVDDIQAVLKCFKGVPHRLEFVRDVGGVRYLNDSIATSPDRTKVALEAVPKGCVLIAGGYDKKIAFDLLGEIIAEKVQHLILLGETAQKIANIVPPDAPVEMHFVKDLNDAVSLAYTLASPGQTVLLSPASASYDQFLNFERRGEAFKILVGEITD